jgi:ATP-dependent DNA helicase RecG
LRDYAAMSVAERRRRAMAAIDLLRTREQGAIATKPAAKPARPPAAATTATTAAAAVRKRAFSLPALPQGHELLEMPISQLAPRARWPNFLTAKLNLYTVRDLLYHIPRDWVEIAPIAELADGARAAIIGTVLRREYDRLHSKTAPRPLYKYTLTVTDGSGEAWVSSITIASERGGGQQASWSPVKLPFRPGQRIFVLGKVDRTGQIIQLAMEDIFEIGELESALAPGMKVPLYPLTNGVYQNQVHRAILRVLAALGVGESANALLDPLPEAIRTAYDLLPLLDALRELHSPRTPEHHEQARKRLAFEEFLTPQLVLAQRRWQQHHQQDAPVCTARESIPDLVARLAPFEPTPAQFRVLAEIEADLRSPRPMNRLLQGDVGSGKTLVAAGALAFAVRSGMQAAIMAPTEILAEQLYLVLTHLLQPLAITPVLLTGSQSAPARRDALTALATGTASIAVGTQALIQEGVTFRNLGLTIVDEQHRFGVHQRATLRSKGQMPNALIMTATPIPRTLALTVYGDLDVSILDGLPPGRRPVETRWVPMTELPEAYRFLRAEISAGRQAYVLCPLVEQSELLQADAATEMAAALQRVFPEFRIGLLHGRLRPEEKDAAMEAFRAGRTHILACTTVVEVGVDVPNATVMLIQNAERFGLAQLHQLRGRVGRSHHQSYCLLVTLPRFDPAVQAPDEPPARKRLRIMLHEQDGFAIAEADLEIRGPGEYLGTRQSGLLDFKIGSLPRDGAYLEMAREAAHALIADDPTLQAPAHAELRRRAQTFRARLDQFRE